MGLRSARELVKELERTNREMVAFLLELKAALIEAEGPDDLWDQLAQLNAATVAVAYSGSDDEGWINTIRAKDSYGRVVREDLGGQIHDPSDPLIAAIYEVAWDVLERYHVGWENNEGGQGTIEFDVGARSVHVSHGTAIENVEWEDYDCNAEFERVVD